MALLEASFLWPLWIIKDWSLITRRGGYKTGGGGGGGASEVLPLQKGGPEKVLAMLKGGGHKQF